MSRWTRQTSSALHTDGRLVLAFSMIFTAMLRSASLSTYTWQMPVPVSMQGTLAFSTHARMSPLPPRGISRSTRPSAEAAAEIIPGTAATELDFDTEFLDYILAVAVVDDLDAAIAHVQHHSTHHSDCIVTENQAAADRFVDEVDSAAVYVNVSTRFTDGGEFGLGCEMGISTQKLHARGPMGLDELSTYKYVITGSGQIR